MKESPRISISSPPDRKYVVADIFFGETQWVEINCEDLIFRVEFYARPDGEPWRIEFDDAVAALNEAKQRLERR
jgi:hypothetical protein